MPQRDQADNAAAAMNARAAAHPSRAASSEAGRHLSRISTLWTVVRQAHAVREAVRQPACEQLLDRYSDAIRRYLRAAVRSTEAGDELYQEFAVRFLSGRFRGADPKRGRFRDYVKTSLYHLIADYKQSRFRDAANFDPAAGGPDVDAPPRTDADESFLQSWRDSLLARTWRRLSDLEASTGQPLHTILRTRVDEPALNSIDFAGRLSERLGRRFTDGAARTALHRARRKFAELLVADVADSLADPSDEDVEAELIALGLIEYCRPVLKSPFDSAGEAGE